VVAVNIHDELRSDRKLHLNGEGKVGAVAVSFTMEVLTWSKQAVDSPDAIGGVFGLAQQTWPGLRVDTVGLEKI